MLEISQNENLASLLQHHGVGVHRDEEFVYTDLPRKTKFKTRIVYREERQAVNSQLDILAIPQQGEHIYESFGDVGTTLEDAVARNFQNFSRGSLHPLLAMSGSQDPHTLQQVETEEWKIGDTTWKAYLGSLTPKTNSKNSVSPPKEFFQRIESGIRSQTLANRLHWFRSYYAQFNDQITISEFLMDNQPVNESGTLFLSLPTLPDTDFYSCRNFIILQKTDS
ncbi:DUF6348 family protein [Chryseolinea lacunae]|uniref:Uncharacterized protein n=1 Tax=Chryseolinea lacunae TaxID=2801331 RepID=A0ABS1KW54_9BACT|nr:DUF6348 family protein [Chryseolinea lacunae]MBL0743680.1 hypothetical protein [Chryseolinea lacunae]